MDLDINLDQSLAERIDLYKTRVDSFIEFPELGDKSDVALTDLLIGIRAANDAGNSPESTHTRADSINYEKS